MRYPARLSFSLRRCALLAAAFFCLCIWPGHAQNAPTPTMFPAVRGLHEMVGAANNFEVEAGYRMLTQGGNAVDAGVASVLAAGVTELSRFGLRGEMPWLARRAGDAVVGTSVLAV